MGTQAGLKDFLTIGCAALGAVLGVINYVAALNQRRVKLRVIPKMAVGLPTGFFSHRTELLPNSAPAIEVINLSAFPVTISEAGFTLRRQTDRVICQGNSPVENKPWLPRRVESRESVTVYFLFAASEFPKNLYRAYAETDCQERRFGNSPALKKFRALLQEGSR
jgi:hypothetical protein